MTSRPGAENIARNLTPTTLFKMFLKIVRKSNNRGAETCVIRLNSPRVMVKTNYMDKIKGPAFGSLRVDEITYLSYSCTQNLEIR